MTCPVVGKNVSVNASLEPYWRNDEKLALMSGLMHQQLYVIGRDIESKHGNLLMQFGAKKTCAPEGCAVSLYSFTLPGKYRLALRGFGVFIGADHLGGIFIRRYEVEPRWMPSSRFEPIVWLPQQMPRLRKVRVSEIEPARKLTDQVMQFFICYELWIRERFGKRLRVGQLVSFKRLGNQRVYWDMAEAWEDVRK